MDFNKIKANLTDNKPETFLNYVLQETSSDDSFIIFSQTINEQFAKNCHYLASNQTVSEKELKRWKEEHVLVIAQTIDGDYIAGNSKKTFVIPVSLYKSEIETYPYSLADFFIAYMNDSISSSILPNNN